MPNYALCKKVEPATTFESGLINPKDFDKDVVTEGVAHIRAVCDHMLLGSGADAVRYPCPLEVGDYVIYRGFLRFAIPVNDVYAEEEGDFFIIRIEDVLAVVEPDDVPGTIGHYGEYRF